MQLKSLVSLHAVENVSVSQSVRKVCYGLQGHHQTGIEFHAPRSNQKSGI